MSFKRLIRFYDKDGIERYGDVEDDIASQELVGKSVKIVSGNLELGFKVLEDRIEVAKVG